MYATMMTAKSMTAQEDVMIMTFAEKNKKKKKKRKAKLPRLSKMTFNQ